MSTKTMRVGYRLVRNATSTADRAPYLGVAVPIGSLAYDNILQRMLERGTFMTRATAQYFLNEFYEYVAKVVSDDIVRINMGAVSIYPMIGGSFDSEDDEFRAPRNTLYVGATLSQEIREAVSGMSPTSLGAGTANGTVKISSVMDLASETYRLIDGLKEFRIAGIDLTVPDGEDESLSLVAADGLTKVADITVVSTQDGQRIVCTLASAVPAGTYHVRFVSHGLDPTAPLVTALYKVAVKAAPGPEPEPIAESSDGTVKVMTFTDGGQSETFTAGHTWTMTGEGLFTEAVEGRRWRLGMAGIRIPNVETAVLVEMTPAADGKSATLAQEPYSELPPAGTYANATLTIPLVSESDPGAEETLEIPITFVVEE